MPVLLLDGSGRRRAYLYDARRYPSDHRKIRNVAHDNSVRADDYVVADAYAAQDLCPSSEMHPVADDGRTKCILCPCFTQGAAGADQTIIAHDGRAVNADAAVMFDAQPAADLG